MAIKTTFVYPGIAGRGFNSLKQGMEAGWISHGLASLSSAAKAQGFEIDLIDLRALAGWDHFRQVLAERNPDVVGVTMMSVDYNPARQAIAIAKEVKPEIITVIGGPHVTIALEDSLRISHVDYLVTGEGEMTFPKLLRAIEKSQAPDHRVLRGETPDLDAIPLTDRGLFLDESPLSRNCQRRSPPSSPGGAASTTAPFASPARTIYLANAPAVAVSTTSSPNCAGWWTGIASPPSCSTTTA